jgi:hypothetical protein
MILYFLLCVLSPRNRARSLLFVKGFKNDRHEVFLWHYLEIARDPRGNHKKKVTPPGILISGS